jgi:hypothetical protein
MEALSPEQCIEAVGRARDGEIGSGHGARRCRRRIVAVQECGLLTSIARDRRLIWDAMQCAIWHAQWSFTHPRSGPWLYYCRASDCPLIDKNTRFIWITARRLRILFHSSCRCIGDGKEVQERCYVGSLCGDDFPAPISPDAGTGSRAVQRIASYCTLCTVLRNTYCRTSPSPLVSQPFPLPSPSRPPSSAEANSQVIPSLPIPKRQSSLETSRTLSSLPLPRLSSLCLPGPREVCISHPAPNYGSHRR